MAPPQFSGHDFQPTVLSVEATADGTLGSVMVEYTMPTGERASGIFQFTIWNLLPASYEAELDAAAQDELRRSMNGDEPTWAVTQPRRRR